MLVAAVAGLLLAAGAGDVDQNAFRYARTLDATGHAPALFEPDARMYGHARSGFPDLRILDADGTQVPWRPEPKPAVVPAQSVRLIARGRRGGTVSVVLDRGPLHRVVDRVELEIPDRTFTGDVVVFGSAKGAEGTYARLGSTPIYAVHGAVDARSTTALFPATDYRYLLVQASGVSDVTGAQVARNPEETPLEPVSATSRLREQGRTTVVRLDLGFPRVPVDGVRIESTTPRFVRAVTVEGSNDGTTFVLLAHGRVARFPGIDLTRVPVDGRERYLRVTIENGDDPPLDGLRATAEASPRPLLLAGGHRPPYRLLYGAVGVPPPAYDFQQLPAAATGVDRAVAATLRPESLNDAFEAPADTRTFLERNDWVVQVLLVAAALVAGAAGLVALRRRTT